jgi:hypothetical protein
MLSIWDDNPYRVKCQQKNAKKFENIRVCGIIGGDSDNCSGKAEISG